MSRTSQANRQIDGELLGLVRPDIEPSSRSGIYFTLFAILLIIILFATLSRFITIENRNIETQAMAAFNEAVAYRAEDRLVGITDRFNDVYTSSNLDGICKHGRGIFNEFPEVLEVSLVNSDGNVIDGCANPSALGELTRLPGTSIRRVSAMQAVYSAHSSNSAAYSIPYVDENAAGSPFVDAAIPNLLTMRTVIVRVSLAAILRNAVVESPDPTWHFDFVVNGVVLSNTNDMAGTHTGFANETTVPPLPTSAKLRLANPNMGLFYNHSVFIWGILTLMTLLVTAIILILRYQYRQLAIEEQLKARMIVQQAMARSYSNGLCVTDSDGRILYVNQTFEDMFGFTGHEMVGDRIPYPFWPKERRETVTGFEDLVKKAGSDIEFSAVRKNGSTFDCSAEVQPLESENGTQFGWLIAYSDITIKKQAALEKSRAHERLKRVFDSMDTAISVVDMEGGNELLLANSSYITSFGNSASAHLRMNDLLNDLAETERAMGVVFDETTGQWFSVHRKGMLWIDGRNVLAITAANVTERKNKEILLEQQMKNAEQSNRLITMGEMASSLAHEINQPLAAVQNYASAVLDLHSNRKLREELFVESMEKIIRQTKRAAQIIKRIRGFAKRSEPVIQEANVRRIVDETLELAGITAKKLGMTIEVDMPDELPEVMCDAVLISQVLLNLLKNGMEASDPAQCDRVKLDVSTDENAIRFEVSDRGHGIPGDVKTRLFEPFFSTKQTGMGIGLNICRSIIESHHGRMVIRDNENGGTVFVITIPINGRALKS